MSLDKYKFVMKYILRLKNTHFYNTNEFVGNVENICIDRTYLLAWSSCFSFQLNYRVSRVVKNK